MRSLYLSARRSAVSFPINQSLSRFRDYHHLRKAVFNSSTRPQIFLSQSLDPHLNLSIEHLLLQNTDPQSTVLFLYTNKPCIVIGRNQNPWVEANLLLLRTTCLTSPSGDAETIELVRRRSGGGTVFHDRGNVNYSVICPTGAFDRDRHAEMVVRALKALGVSQAKVNQRHDIVLQRQQGLQPLKVSGSAYKVTRLRSLHHGTCLLSSPNIGDISKYLRSPARPFIQARGADSVNSPVANVNISNESFRDAVMSEFRSMYSGAEGPTILKTEVEFMPEIQQGLAEIKSLDWTYLQTPQFTFSTHRTVDDDRKRPNMPQNLPSTFSARFTVRHGIIIEASARADGTNGASEVSLLETKLHEIKDWTAMLPHDYAPGIGKWLQELFVV